ncbi:MAG: hypothetical protein ACERKV_10780 [Clostridiaceae bacterium]
MKKKFKIVLITLVLFILFITVTIILLVRPTQKLNFQYTSIDLYEKISEDVFNFNGNISFTDDELTNVIKENLIQTENEALDYVTGVALDIKDNKANLYINIKYNIFKVGFRGVVTISSLDDELLITPTKFYLGRIPLSTEKTFSILNKINPEISDMLNEDGQYVINSSEIANLEYSEYICINNISLEKNSLNISFEMPTEAVANAVSTGIDMAVEDDRIQDETRTEIANAIEKHSNNNISKNTIEDLSKGTITTESKNEIIDSITTMTAEEQNNLLKEVSALVDPEILEQYMQIQE